MNDVNLKCIKEYNLGGTPLTKPNSSKIASGDSTPESLDHFNFRSKIFEDFNVLMDENLSLDEIS